MKDLWQLQIPSDKNKLIFQENNSVKGLLILYNAIMQQGISKEPLLKKTFDYIVKSVFKLLRYFGQAIVHVIQRYLDKKVNDKLS